MHVDFTYVGVQSLAKFSLEFEGRDWLFTDLCTMAYYTSVYMMYSRHSCLAQLFGDDSDGFRSGLDDDSSDMEIVVE
jgi:hypothetical protein